MIPFHAPHSLLAPLCKAGLRTLQPQEVLHWGADTGKCSLSSLIPLTPHPQLPKQTNSSRHAEFFNKSLYL